METNTCDECGVLANVEVYETMDDRKSGNIKDEQGSGKTCFVLKSLTYFQRIYKNIFVMIFFM